MNIEINVSEIDLSSVVETTYDGEEITLADLVARQLADRFVNEADWKPLRQRTREIRDEEIRAQLAPMIAEALEAPVQRTNAYGEPIGDAVSMRDVVVDEARKILNGSVRSAYGDRNLPLGRKLIKEAVDRTLTKELGDVIADERTKVVNAVREKAASIIADAVSKGVGGR